MRTIITILLFVLSPVLVLASELDQQTDDIHEAVVRYEMAYAKKLKHEPKAWFLRAYDSGQKVYRDPGDAFVKRFAAMEPPLESVSQVKFRSYNGNPYIPENEGHLLTLKPVTWLSDDKVQTGLSDGVNGGGTSLLFSLSKKNGSWRVLTRKIELQVW